MLFRTRGTTLLELLVVLGLLSVVLGTVSPRLSEVLAGVELRSGAWRLSSALMRARFGALAHGNIWSVAVTDPSAFEVGSVAGVERISLPGRVRFLRATSGGEVRFRPNGGAENATFTLGHGARTRAVVVNQRGRVSVGGERAR